ncbi:MAG: HAMP domain-containing histidine kinase, partial [Chlorobi bacterium]|nr:HAMP domain-containing histidine kinase [Chlorobiota bacterium]
LAKEKAENADKLKSIFLAQMSHEIRTPINAMLSLSSLLKDDLEDQVDEDFRISFELINKAGMRIIRTVDLLLNLSEIQAGTYEIITKKFDLYADVLGKIVVDYKKHAGDKNISLRVELETEDAEIVADSYTVTQIFTQLMDNAVKYTASGQIIVRIFRSKEGKLVAEISDSGIGIAEKYLSELFAPFSQEDSGYTRKYEGNGIGLALVKKYCELNNATIEVESQKGIGSTFRVVF